MKSKNMITYTIKKGASEHPDAIRLYDERGQEVNALDMLKRTEPHRLTDRWVRVRRRSSNISVSRWVRWMW